jgi:hypothetical protein
MKFGREGYLDVAIDGMMMMMIIIIDLIILSSVWVTIEEVWIGNWFY